MNPVTPLTATPTANSREDLAKAAQGFEAIFVRQMLAAARKADFGGDDMLAGKGLETFRQMQDERFADIAAERGSFGLAKMIEAQLARQVGQENS
jgi:flagellar protein FlgJ